MVKVLVIKIKRHDVWWHDNGKKWMEVTHKDGKEISTKYWNSKGEPVDYKGDPFDSLEEAKA